MFRGQAVQEKVSVIGTEAFMDFVESIKVEGVELEYQPMGERTGPKSPIVVEVDRENEQKDIDQLDIELPVLAPRIYREYKNLERNRRDGAAAQAAAGEAVHRGAAARDRFPRHQHRRGRATRR